MNSFPDDPKLKAFLQQHQPQPPAASPELEAQILAAIATPTPASTPGKLRALPHRHPWLVLSAIAASLVVGVVSYRTWVPTTPNPTEVASLGSFIENSWTNTVTDPPEDELLPNNGLSAN